MLRPPTPGAPSLGSGRSVPTGPYWQIPSLAADDRLVGGVASGLAREAGVDPFWIRLAFVVLFAAGGWGGLMYLVLWGLISYAEYEGHVPTSPPVPKGRTLRHRLGGLTLVVGGLLLMFVQFGGAGSGVIWPLGVLGGGVLVALRRSAPRSRSRLPAWIPRAQIVGGVVAAVGALAGAQALGLGASDYPVLFASAFVGVVVVSAPWWWQLVTDLDRERQARARSDERAEVVAHIHDSVLQTLLLIQKGDDPQQMVQLARRQERELRNWIDPDRASRSGAGVRGQLDAMASDIEELHGVEVDVVCVADALVEPPIDALLAATREAVVNAAKHSGADKVDVYVEVGVDQVEIFVRDTGIGFDPGAVGVDRRGLSESIIGRMDRVGGRASVISEPGEGTEVELRVSRFPAAGKEQS